jgi:hypothetical protein
MEVTERKQQKEMKAAIMFTDWIQKLSSRRFRKVLYLCLGAFFFCSSAVLSLVQMRFDGIFTFIRADGRAYYLYLPSLVVDGDLDFSNELKNPWNRDYQPLDPADRTPLGYINNKYPIGLALTITPPFLVAHGISRAVFALTKWKGVQPNGYTVLYQLFCAGFIMALGVLLMVFVDSLLTGRFGLDGDVTALAILAYWAGSHFAYYFFREPFMVHIVSAFWITASILLTDRTLSHLDQNALFLRDWMLLTVSLAMAVACRPTNILLFPFLLYLLYQVGQRRLLRRLFKLAPMCLPGLMPLLIQMLVWHHATGHLIFYSYGDEGFLWSRPALWQTLFSSRHGLFFWSPLLGFAIIGMGSYINRDGGLRNSFFCCYLMSFAVLWYFNSAWHMWWFGDAFGARAFLELSSFFILGLSLFFGRIRQSSIMIKSIAVIGILMCIGYNYLLMGLYILSRIPRGDYLL